MGGTISILLLEKETQGHMGSVAGVVLLAGLTNLQQLGPLYTFLPLGHQREANGRSNDAVGTRNGELQE